MNHFNYFNYGDDKESADRKREKDLMQQMENELQHYTVYVGDLESKIQICMGIMVLLGIIILVLIGIMFFRSSGNSNGMINCKDVIELINAINGEKRHSA